MSGLARPELLASTEWLADQLGRPELRILDVRWRPDGTGRAAHAAGHIPGAVHLDWRTDLIDPSDTGDALLLAGPDQVAAPWRAAGVSDGATRRDLRRHASACSPPRTWWSLRVYGLESARILDGGYPPGSTKAGRSRTPVVPPAAGRFTPRAQPRMRLTTPDVRALLGSPDVALIDARAPAEYRGLRGQHQAPRAHPGRGQRAGRRR